MTENSTSILPAQFMTALDNLGFHIDGHDPVDLEPLHKIVEKWNKTLGYTAQSLERFRYAECDPQSQDLVPIPPIPFTAIGWPIKVVFWGLNPHYDLGALEEKLAAFCYRYNVSPGTWEAYAHFYLNYPFTETEPWPGSLKWAISSTYYYNLGTVTGTLKNRQFALLKDKYDMSIPPPQRRLEAFWGIAQDYGVMAVEYLPFHSQKAAFPPILAKKFGATNTVVAQAAAYHATLLQTIEQVLEPGGWIVAMGKPCTVAVRALLQKTGTLTRPVSVNGGISLETWKPTGSEDFYKVSCGPFIGTAGGPINSNAAIQNWLEAMLIY